MALHSLTISDGIDTATLTTAPCYLLDYTPTTPQKTDEGWQDVTEAATILIKSTTSALVQAALNEIEQLLQKAEAHQGNELANKCYVTYQLSSDAAAWRSEILAGRVELDGDAWRHWNALSIEVVIVWTRRYFWEGVEAELKTTAVMTEAPVTGGTVITNNGGTGLFIDAADIAGVIPAPVRLEMTNNNGASVSTRRFWLSLNVFSAPESQIADDYHILEGEAVTSVSTGGSAVVSATSRGGYYEEMAWTGSATHAGNFMNWTIPAANLVKFAGGKFRVLARFVTAPTANTYIKLALKIPAGATPLTTIWQSAEVALSSTYLLQDLGTVPLPPIGLSAFDDVALILSARCATTGEVRVDFLALLATDGMHTFEQIGYQIPANDKIIADGIVQKTVYYQSAAGKQLSIYSDNPPHLHLWPGRDQALEILFDESASMTIARTLSVRAYYRPRRLTV